MSNEEIKNRFQEAVQFFWDSRSTALNGQRERGVTDTGNRGAATANRQMSKLEELIVSSLEDVGLHQHCFRTRSAIELPGYYRPEKQWDLLIVDNGKLVCALEFKSQVGPSFGNNFNNRVEEAIGSASDIWVAYREGRFGTHRPLLGYFFLLEDCPAVHNVVSVRQPHFPIDPIFKETSYGRRYQILCERLLLERIYDTACLALATNAIPTAVQQPSEELTIVKFVAQIRASVEAYVRGR
ncbi:MAG TPA: PaeR7I family type II restriction endonuclease [Candidatus Kapabacteria bacterium]